MLGREKLWEIQEYDKKQAALLAEELHISPLVTGILLGRGLTNAADMRLFLYGAARPFHDPFLLRGMSEAVERIELALKRGELITVDGDYDVDGITASSLLYIYLRERGGRVNTYIPRRQGEGYGLNDEALKNIHASGTGLLITVDCGISGAREVAAAPPGLDMIITDHHTVPELLPQACAIIDPGQKDCAYPFKQLSGAGVAFKLCQALEQRRSGTQDYWEGLLELAALGTVADVVPLLDENREIVRRGLLAMEKTQLVGLQALIKASGCPQKDISTENIGYNLAPRLNAVGRLEHAQSAVRLLTTSDAAEAEKIAAELNRENMTRQEISRRILEEAEAMLARAEHIDTAIVLASEGWHQGVIGIVASRLVDKYHLPTILFSISDGVARGSCRSIPALDMYAAIASASELLTRFGGHHQAAGLTLSAERLEEFTARFKAYVARHLSGDDYLPRQKIDCLLEGEFVLTQRDLQELALLEPCGRANPAPVFAVHNAVLGKLRAMGKDKQHLQFTLTSGKTPYRTVMWNRSDLLPFLYEDMHADVAFMPAINEWQGEKFVQLQAASLRQQAAVCDLRRAAAPREETLRALAATALGLTVYVNKLPEAPFSAAGCLHWAVYGELPRDAAVVFYDLPAAPLADACARMWQNAVKSIILMYNDNDMREAAAALNLRYPGRSEMAAAYTGVMAAFRKSGGEPVSEDAVEAAETALAVLAELGYIVRNNGSVSLGTIRKRRLEDSPLYRALQSEKQKLLDVYKENMRLTQGELLRQASRRWEKD